VGEIVLTNGNLEVIPEVLHVSKSTMGALYQNISVFAFANVAGISLATIGILSPIAGAVLHLLQESFGFLNSLRLAK
jgi:cation transport ATPase